MPFIPILNANISSGYQVDFNFFIAEIGSKCIQNYAS